MNYPYVYIDHAGCGGMAFYLSRVPGIGDPMRSAEALTLNGTTPNGQILCGSCGQPMQKPTRDAIVGIR